MKESNRSETEEERKGLREGEKKRVRGEQRGIGGSIGLPAVGNETDPCGGLPYFYFSAPSRSLL